MVDKLVEKLAVIITALRNNFYYKKFAVPFSIISIVLLIFFMIKEVPYSYIELGKTPSMGFKGTFFWIFVVFLAYKFESEILKFQTLGCLMVILPLFVVFLFNSIYSLYSKNVYYDLIEESNVIAGTIYDKKSQFGRGYKNNFVVIGYDNHGIHKFVKVVSKKTYEMTNVGDSIIIEYSRAYPRVMNVLKYNPTEEEIEKFKTPRKFKSYIFGTINVEDD